MILPATFYPLTATRYPSPATRYPSPATRYPPPATRGKVLPLYMTGARAVMVV